MFAKKSVPRSKSQNTHPEPLGSLWGDWNGAPFLMAEKFMGFNLGWTNPTYMTYIANMDPECIGNDHS